MSESTRAMAAPAPVPAAVTPERTASSDRWMPALGPALTGAPPPPGDDRQLIGGVQRRAGNRAAGALIERMRTRSPLEAMWHEASRTGSRAAATRVAERAVAGARPGGLPHGEHIRAVSKGKVDPAGIPATVVDELPALGVCYDGKIAVRRGAPKSIVAHEVAHSMGADEATAHRVERDPGLLAGLTPKAPVNGWAIGFEFQCVGASNPKVYKRAWQAGRHDLPGRHVWNNTSGAEVIGAGEGFKFEHDGRDLEVETDPFDETDTGREVLWSTMKALEAEMARLRTPKQEDDAPDDYKVLQDNPIKFSAWDWVTTFDKDGSHYAVGAKDNAFTAHPQATIGVTAKGLDKVIDMLISADARKHASVGWGESGSVRAASKGAEGHSMWAAVTWADGVLDLVLEDFQVTRSDVGGLAGLLKLLATYVAGGKMLGNNNTNLKNLAPFMLRNSVLELYGLLTDDEKAIFASMQRKTKVGTEDFPKSVAYALSFGNNAKYRAAMFLPHRVSEPEDGWTDIDPNTLTITQIVDGIIGGTDYLKRSVESHAIHKLAKEDMKGDVASTTDIGQDRSGVLVELRRLPKQVPYTRWKQVALDVFDFVRSKNAEV